MIGSLGAMPWQITLASSLRCVTNLCAPCARTNQGTGRGCSLGDKQATKDTEVDCDLHTHELSTKTTEPDRDLSVKECLACGGAGCGICKLRCGQPEVPQGGLLCLFFPVSEEVIDALCNSAELKDALTSPCAEFVDLGCGDGRVVIEVASRFQCICRGVELDESLVDVAEKTAKQKLSPNALKRVHFVTEDFRVTNLQAASAVFLFVPQHVIEFVFREVLPRSSLHKGATIIVCGRKEWCPSTDILQAIGACNHTASHATNGYGQYAFLHCFTWSA